MNIRQKTRILFFALAATASLLLFYFVLVTAVSGLRFASSQFLSYWYFLTGLALGFGIQVGLYLYLRQLVKDAGTAMRDKTVAVTGTTSTLAMVSCCAHYLANVVPLLGVAGALSVIAQYQIKIFWVALVFNALGIAFIGNKIIKFRGTVARYVT